jgi:serine-type D-Ala-D-Ala carboxypeptidase (penicillin-binding protein 5/6)
MPRPTSPGRPAPLLVLSLVVALAALMVVVTRAGDLPDGDASRVVLPDLGAPAGTAPPPTVPGALDAAAYLVLDVDSGAVLAAYNPEARLAIGSIGKLMTAHVVMQAGEPDRIVTIPPLDLAADESAIGLRPGEQQRRDVLVRAMLIVSANDAARALAIDVAGSEQAFVDRMNEAADDLGLDDTRFANPVGLDDPAQHSTARDVARLAVRVLDDPELGAVVSRRSAVLHGSSHAATNDLLSTYDGADGIKTGHTSDAGWCIVASATRAGRRVVAVVLGSSSEEGRDSAARTLLDAGFASPE